MRHRRITRTDNRRDIRQADLISFGKGNDQTVDVLYHLGLEFVKGVIFFTIDDSANVILTEIDLAVIFRFGIDCRTVGNIHQVRDNRSRTEIHRNSIIGPAAIARFDLNKFGRTTAKSQSHRHLVIGFLKYRRQLL